MQLVSKTLILIATTLLLLAITASSALAIEPVVTKLGYNNPLENTTTPKGPHGGYATTTNKCKDCHAVHIATGAYMLTRVNNRSDTCNFCHGGGGPGTNVIPNENGCGAVATTTPPSTEIAAPDDTRPQYKTTAAKWGCLECHSVHDNQTVKLSNYVSTMLLKANPNPDYPASKTYLNYTPVVGDTTQTVSQWCSCCHNADFGLHTQAKQVTIDGINTITAYGHDSSGGGYTTNTAGWANVNPLDGVNNGPTCKQCHPADGGNFPHSGSKAHMLKASSDPNAKLDWVCMNCHNTSSLQ